MELTPILIFAIVTWGVYRLFELYARRKERLMIIEKMDPERWKNGIDLDVFPKKQNRNTALAIGLLLMGIGFGLLVGFIIYISLIEYARQLNLTYYIKEMILGPCVLLFGGAGLLTAYLIERKQGNKNN